VKLLWINNQFATGPYYGYSIHNHKMKQALLEAGVAITADPSEDFDIAIHITNPHFFKPIPGKKNLLFTQVEMSEPFEWSETVGLADLLVTSCTHSREVLARHYTGRIDICPEGVDPSLFPCWTRRAPSPDEPFRFLFFGYLGERRKGADPLFAAWRNWQASGRMPQNVELYVKSSGHVNGRKYQLPAAAPRALADMFALDPEKRNDLATGWPLGTIKDTRNLSAKEIADLFNSAACFLSPSGNEAWNLCLTEAMSTGCPCVWTAHSAMLDYADSSIGYPITDYEMIPFYRNDERYALGAMPSADAILARMEEIYRDYPAALERGRAASERMRTRFTWRQAAEKFIEICTEVTK